MMLVITFEGHKTNLPFRNQGPGLSNQMKAKSSNPALNSENEPVLSSILIRRQQHSRDSTLIPNTHVY